MSNKTIVPDDNLEWTAKNFVRAKRGGEIPAHILAAFPKTRDRPVGSNKQLINLRLVRDVIEHFKASGPGWQSRINDVLRKANG